MLHRHPASRSRQTALIAAHPAASAAPRSEFTATWLVRFSPDMSSTLWGEDSRPRNGDRVTRIAALLLCKQVFPGLTGIAGAPRGAWFFCRHLQNCHAPPGRLLAPKANLSKDAAVSEYVLRFFGGGLIVPAFATMNDVLRRKLRIVRFRRPHSS
ncbi:hypothetical protein [Bradyrhizobium lablabi]|uniref:hypothetical protein n=1 Tax=Bradyrhizobium lablabi TaxID=722472 RepID=UPI001BA4D7E3|nr:hypothetical protein [Bradyrhizobium lablabi]MBR0693403.1 hypothetical protein [Bradyrhizobium lablabi]